MFAVRGENMPARPTITAMRRRCGVERRVYGTGGAPPGLGSVVASSSVFIGLVFGNDDLGSACMAMGLVSGSWRAAVLVAVVVGG